MGISFINNKIMHINFTHSSFVNGNKTMLVGQDISGYNSYVVSEISVINTNNINTPIGFNLLINLKEGLIKSTEICPVQDLELMNKRIGFVARACGHE
jgi:hypothetical protein